MAALSPMGAIGHANGEQGCITPRHSHSLNDGLNATGVGVLVEHLLGDPSGGPWRPGRWGQHQPSFCASRNNPATCVHSSLYRI